MSTPDPSHQAFKSAKAAVKQSWKDDSLFEELLATTSVKKVYKAAEDVQTKPHADRRLQNTVKSRSLDKLTDYASAVNTFVQVQPDVLALIWGIFVYCDYGRAISQSFPMLSTKS